MPTTRSPPIDEWMQLERGYLQQGLSRHRAHRLIAEQHDVHPQTVYLRLTPHALERKREYDRKRRQDRSRESVISPASRERHRRYNASYRRRPDVVERNRHYQRAYKQAYRHILDIAQELSFESYDGDLTNRVVDELYNRTGIRIRRGTIEKVLSPHYAGNTNRSLYELSLTSL